MTTHKDYVLGTDPAELARLGLQSHLFSSESAAIWHRAGFRAGQTILDVGSGPGFTSRELAGFIGPTGKVLAVDESQKYLDYINSLERQPHMAEIQTRRDDVQTMNLAPSSLDGAYARWVLCFVANPEAVVERVARALKPGACFAVQEYARYTGLTWGPQRTMNTRIMDAVAHSWKTRGGDPDVGLRLPSYMDRHNLEVMEVRSLVRAARPVDPLWQWPDSYFRVFLPKLVASGDLSQAEFDAWTAEWDTLSANPASVFIGPTMVEIIARKPA